MKEGESLGKMKTYGEMDGWIEFDERRRGWEKVRGRSVIPALIQSGTFFAS